GFWSWRRQSGANEARKPPRRAIDGKNPAFTSRSEKASPWPIQAWSRQPAARFTGRYNPVMNFERGLRRLPPIGVRGILPRCGKVGHQFMIGREMADRVGSAGIAGEQKSLVTAAAEVERTPRAARARLAHPATPAEGAEGRRLAPDIGQGVVAHRPKFEAGDHLGGVARKHAAGRRDVERATAPAADARLRI